MTPIYTSDEIRSADARAIQELGVPSLVLMENAARGACDVLLEAGLELSGSSVVVVCGRGNNGGDGIALTRHLLIHGADVACVVLDPREQLSEDALAQLTMLEKIAPDTIVPWSDMERTPGVFDIVVDALLGTGASGAPRGAYAEAVDWMNSCVGFKLAIDVPTGLDADSGAAPGPVFSADATSTMAGLKPGLLLRSAPTVAGSISVVHIGVPTDVYPVPRTWLLDDDLAAGLLPPVVIDRHKYDRGRVLIMAGSVGMTGAGTLAAQAAARSGAGLVVYAWPSAASPLPQLLPPEIITKPCASSDAGTFAAAAIDEIAEDLSAFDCVVAGPGFRKISDAPVVIAALVERVACPLVLDADGLAPYAGCIEELAHRTSGLIITPHHGEMARLMGLDTAAVTEDAPGVAREAARRSGAIVVLKGAPTVVATPAGDLWINSAGNPGMATGGSGDVLAGMIAGMVTALKDELAGTLAAVFLHSLAGDIASAVSTEHAMTASDIVLQIPRAFRELVAEVE